MLLLCGNIQFMDKENKTSKDRELTEQRMLQAVGEIIAEDGFEKVGVNLLAQKAGVSKMLIYRYFGSIEGVIAAYILEKDYWINIAVDESAARELAPFIKKVFADQIAQLRQDVSTRRLCRWELSAENSVIDSLREKRETNACRLIALISQLSHSPQKEIASLAAILSASISYLALLEDSVPVYNGISLQTDEGWGQITEGINLIIDLWIQHQAH